MEHLDVEILGRSYRLSCAPEEKTALLAAVAYLNGKMVEIRQNSKISGHERITVLAALNIANELLTARAPNGAFSDVAFGEFKRRIESMNTVIDAVVNPQEKLF